MKVRLITAGICIALLFGVISLPSIVLTCFMSAICVIAVHEILTVTHMAKHISLKIVSLLFAATAPFFAYMPAAIKFVTCVAYMLALLILQIIFPEKVPLEKVGGSLLLSVCVAVSLSCISYLRTAGPAGPEDITGLFYMMLTLVIAWLTDSGAYFVGTFFGKHKLCPRISPKKTVEGLIGGIVCSILCSLFTAWIYQSFFLGASGRVSYTMVFILALIGSPLSVVGDLFASVLKRTYGVKDFGNIFPGHGGVMDRFDSLIPVLPVVYFAVTNFSLVIY